jgi:hypothetical protein
MGAKPTFEHTVRLRSGGRLTFSGRFDLYNMTPRSRAFLFATIDSLRAYETETAKLLAWFLGFLGVVSNLPARRKRDGKS